MSRGENPLCPYCHGRNNHAPGFDCRVTRATQLDIATAAIGALERRCAELEDEVSTLKLALDEFTPCDECGVVFMSRDAYGEHNCHGRQGR